MERKIYYATATEIKALEDQGIYIVYDLYGELAQNATQGIFITDRSILDDGRGPFVVTEITPDPPQTSA